MVYLPPEFSLLEATDTQSRNPNSHLSPHGLALQDSSATSPLVNALYDADVLLVPMDTLMLPGLSPTSSVDAKVPLTSSLSASIEIPIGTSGSTGSRRKRSASLFSNNSIWNDDALLNHSPSRASNLSNLDIFHETQNNLTPGLNSGHPFLSPLLGAQLSTLAYVANPTRNRSHTTTGQMLEHPRIGLLPLTGPQKGDLASHPESFMLNVLDPANLQQTRNRSQTYSGVNPTIPEGILVDTGTMYRLVNPKLPSDGLKVKYHSDRPTLLQNNYDFSEAVITTNFENPSLGPTKTLLFDNVPVFMEAASLLQLINNVMAPIGSYSRGIVSVRVSPANVTKMALVECSSVESAMSIKANFNHLELVPGVILYVAFAQLTSRVGSRGSQHSPPGFEKQYSKSPEAAGPSLLRTAMRLGKPGLFDTADFQALLDGAKALSKSDYYADFGPSPETVANRQFDASRLREVRKSLENSEAGDTSEGLTQLQIESLAKEMLNELPELCHDHIGNTVVQKVFQMLESPSLKLTMVQKIARCLTQLSIHKNGTWAIQKIINLARSDAKQMELIAASLKPYSVKLFNDQFGNYVLQCCLKFGPPHNKFLFESIVDNFLEISSGRFGARCIRTMLDSANLPENAQKPFISNEQIFLVSSLIVANARELAVNNNGALLITWFLDTFSGPKELETDPRYEMLATQLMPHLDSLCVHKVASAVILKLLGNRVDENVRFYILQALFGPYVEEPIDDTPSATLKFILAESNDTTTGPLFISKVLVSPGFLAAGNEQLLGFYQQHALNQIRRALIEANIQNPQPYKKLFEEVGFFQPHASVSGPVNRKVKRVGGKMNGKHNLGFADPQPFNNGPTRYFDGQGGTHMGHYTPQQQQQQQQFQHDMTVMQQLEQLSLSSAALGYMSNPGTPVTRNMPFTN